MAKLNIHVFLLLIGVAIVIGQTCPGANTVWDDCVPPPACKDHCTKDPEQVCTLQCVPGCKCIPGYKFLSTDSDDCVPENECPSCGTNEEYKVCGTACEPYCGSTPGPCTTECVVDCFCRDGYVRQYNNASACVPVGSC